MPLNHYANGHKCYSKTFPGGSVFYSNRVNWKQGAISFKRVYHNAYPHYGRSAIESGEHLFYFYYFFCLSFKYKTHGLTLHTRTKLPTDKHQPNKRRERFRVWRDRDDDAA